MMVKKIGVVIIMVFLSMPLVQNFYSVLKPKPLSGAFELPDTVGVNIDTWFSGEYQNKLNDFIEYKIGFRPWFVRTRNQVMYSVFGESTSYVELGKNGNLYTWGYFEAYAGLDYLGEERINETCDYLKVVQDLLKDRDKELLVVIAPNKARIMSEYLPEKYKKYPFSITNYDTYKERLNTLAINHIDFNALFEKWHLEKEYPVFPKTGIHWSTYGAMLASDSIVKKMAFLGHEKLPEVTWGAVGLNDEVVGSEDDLERDLNLFFELDKVKLAHPSLIPQNLSNEQKIPGLVISDSFYWNFYDFNFPSNFMRKGSKFLFYNNTAYDEVQESIPVDQLNLSELIASNKYIVLMCTESNFVKFPYGFIDDLKSVLPIEETLANNKLQAQKDNLNFVIESYKTKIYMDEKWKVEIRRKANEKGISFDEMVQLDAEYLAEKDFADELYEKQVQEVIEKIKRSEDWFNDIKNKAKTRNITVDEMLRLDAEYVIDQEKK